VRFFVTGGAGFIGSALVRELIARRFEVFVYDDLSRGSREHLAVNGKVELIVGDVRDELSVRRAVLRSTPDCVVHLAGKHFIPECVQNPAETLETNVGGTRNVLAACVAQRVPSIVLASSAAVYAPSLAPCREADSPLRACDVYGESKIRAEELARFHQAETCGNVVALRIFNAIGPRETNPHLVPHVFESIRTSDAIPLGNIAARRDYVDTRDVARAIAAAAERARGWQIYNVGTGVAHSASAIIEMLRTKLGRPLAITLDSDRLRSTDRKLLVAAVTKIEVDLGWAPRISLSESLDLLIDYYGIHGRARAEPVQDDRRGDL